MADVAREAPPLPLNLTRLLLLLPLLSVGGFVALMMFLWSIFGQWGLSGLQLITMADIAAPSVMLGFIIGALLCVPVLLACAFGWLYSEKPRRFLTIMLWVVAIGGTLLWCVGQLGLLLRLTLVFIATVAAVRIILDARIAKPNSRMLRAAVTIIPALPVAFWVVGSIGAFHGQVVEVGFVRALAVAQKDGAPCDGDILWLGERATVVRCAADRDIRVMTTKEGLPLVLRG
ncbi:hypothetical protein [Brevundimonas naejangsanensis]|uniref:hypothetical protein n=1 Tax=Brevundimonas naejangsanensis TaxID=588932 RepID=UPI003209882B